MSFLCLAVWSTKLSSPFPTHLFWLYNGSFPTRLPCFSGSLLIIVVTHIDGCNSLLWFLEETFESILGAVQTIQATKGPWKRTLWRYLLWTPGHPSSYCEGFLIPEVVVLFKLIKMRSIYLQHVFQDPVIFKLRVVAYLLDEHTQLPLCFTTNPWRMCIHAKIRTDGVVVLERQDWFLDKPSTKTNANSLERTDSQFKTWILLWMTNLFQNNDKETVPFHFTPFAPQFPSKKKHTFWPSLPDAAYLPEP